MVSAPPRATPAGLCFFFFFFCPAALDCLPAAWTNKGRVWSLLVRSTALALGRIGQTGGAAGARPPSEHMSDATWLGRGLWLSEAARREFNVPAPCGPSTRHDLAWRHRLPLPPTRVRPSRPAPVACAERWPLPGPVARSSKWRTRQPGGAGGCCEIHR